MGWSEGRSIDPTRLLVGDGEEGKEEEREGGVWVCGGRWGVGVWKEGGV